MARKNTICKEPINDRTPARHRLFELFWKLGPAFTRWAETHMQDGPLTAQRLRLLGLLFDNGPMKMNQLRNELGVTATNITALVDALEEAGLVTRKPHPTDRRATLIQVTMKAEKKRSECCTEFKERVSVIFSTFNAREQTDLLNYLIRLQEALVARNILKDSDPLPKRKSA